MNEITNNFLYFFFYLFPIIFLVAASKFKPNFDFFSLPIRVVDLLTPYLLLSVLIQTELANIAMLHFYFYIFLNFFGIVFALYLVFIKKRLILSNFFRAWWRYTFIFSFLYHLVIGAYGIFVNIF